ncbi:MAG: helix-turn-helix domain-containing protein [Oscillospiraceae bacterium]|jgi:excisionase family DNA binding protein
MIDFDSVPDVLTLSDLQNVLQIGRSTAYRLVRTREVRSIRIGRCIRIPKQFLAEYVQTRCISVEDRQRMCYDNSNVTTQDGGLSEERSVT